MVNSPNNFADFSVRNGNNDVGSRRKALSATFSLISTSRHCPHPIHGANLRIDQSGFLFLLGNYILFPPSSSAPHSVNQNHSTPLLLIRDCYESTVLTSFFYLLLNYLSHDPDEQRAIFLKEGLSQEADRIALKKGEKPRKWMFPLGFVKAKPAVGCLIF